MEKTPKSYLRTNDSLNIRYQEKLKKDIQISYDTVLLNLIIHSSTLMRFFIYNIMTDVVEIQQQLCSKQHALIDLYIYVYIYESVDSESFFGIKVLEAVLLTA
jgi:hypothetical protein